MVTTYEDFTQDTLKYLHIFDYYDKPLFFITKENNKLQLYRFINDDEDGVFKYFNAVITKDELKGLLHKEIGVKELLTQLIQSQRMEYIFIDNYNKTVNRTSVKHIKDDELPLYNHFVRTDDSTTTPINH
mgnify:CR=1 FL=1